MSTLEAQGSIDPSASPSALFRGNPLPLPVMMGNPFPREDAFATVTCHYDPLLAGDNRNGSVCTRFRAMGATPDSAGLQIMMDFETRSLASLLSYLFDTWRHAQQMVALVLKASTNGILAPELKDLTRALTDHAQQCHSSYEHALERFSILRSLSYGATKEAHTELLGCIYDREAAVGGGQSMLEQRSEQLLLSRSVQLLSNAAARRQVAERASRFRPQRLWRPQPGIPGHATAAVAAPAPITGPTRYSSRSSARPVSGVALT